MPLGISLAMVTMDGSFQVCSNLNGVDMTSQTYTHFIWAHTGDLVSANLSSGSIYNVYKFCEVISTPLSIQFASNLKRSLHT